MSCGRTVAGVTPAPRLPGAEQAVTGALDTGNSVRDHIRVGLTCGNHVPVDIQRNGAAAS